EENLDFVRIGGLEVIAQHLCFFLAEAAFEVAEDDDLDGSARCAETGGTRRLQLRQVRFERTFGNVEHCAAKNLLPVLGNVKILSLRSAACTGDHVHIKESGQSLGGFGILDLHLDLRTPHEQVPHV